MKAAMSHGGLLQAELDGLKACHDKALNKAYSHTSQLQEQLGEQQQRFEETGQELSRCQQALDRCVWSGQHDGGYAMAAGHAMAAWSAALHNVTIRTSPCLVTAELYCPGTSCCPDI